MPMRRFWFLNYQIDRILSQMDLRQLSVASGAQSGDGARELHERLVLEIGKVITVDPVKAAEQVDTSASISTLASLASLPTSG
jgi:hypothetical protein